MPEFSPFCHFLFSVSACKAPGQMASPPALSPPSDHPFPAANGCWFSFQASRPSCIRTPNSAALLTVKVTPFSQINIEACKPPCLGSPAPYAAAQVMFTHSAAIQAALPAQLCMPHPLFWQNADILPCMTNTSESPVCYVAAPRATGVSG